MLQRMRELAVQAISDSNTSNDRVALNDEFKELRTEINRVASNTEWNGTKLIDGTIGASNNGTVTFQIGANAGQTIQVTFADMQTADGNGVALGDLDTDGDNDDDIALVAVEINTAVNAKAALYALAEGISNVDSARATLGASMSRLEYASDNLTNVAQNTGAARSRILDADYAAETTELARTQIIQQASTAMLSQANQSQQQVLALLR